MSKAHEEIVADLLKKFKRIAPAPESPQPMKPTTSLAKKCGDVDPAHDYSQPSTSQQHAVSAVVLESTPIILSTNNMGPNQNTNFADIVSPTESTQTQDTVDVLAELHDGIYLVTTNSLLLPQALQFPNGDALHILNFDQVNSAIMPYITDTATNPVEVSQSQNTDISTPYNIDQYFVSAENICKASDTMLVIISNDLEITNEMNEKQGNDTKNNVTQPISYLQLSPENNGQNPPMLQVVNSSKAKSQCASNAWNSTEANLTQSQPPDENLDSNAKSRKRKAISLNMKEVTKNKLVLNTNAVTANITNNSSKKLRKENEQSREIMKERLNKLLQEVEPSLTLANNVTEALITVADNFLMQMISGAATFAKDREVSTVEIKDLLRYLEKSL